MNNTEGQAVLQLINQKQFTLQHKEVLLLKELTSPECERILNGCGEFRNRIYTPLVTLYTFIKQMLWADKSCKNAVSGVIAGCLDRAKKAISTSTGAYVKARKRIPVELFSKLIKSVSTTAYLGTRADWTFHGRDIKVIDGTTCTLEETKANREAYPPHSNKKKNVGFPIIRLVAIMSLVSGCVIDYAYAACKGKGTGEISLLYRILSCINRNDMILADRYYCHFFLFCDLIKKQTDILVPGHAQRHYDFKQGKRLGESDHTILWKKPRRPVWMSKEEFQLYPKTIEVREFKVNGVVYVTTLLEAKKHPKKELHMLYNRRWEVETHLNSIKTVMGMNRLVCKTPQMVEKEIGVHILGYNIIRKLMVEAAAEHKVRPEHISFKATIQLLNQFSPYLANVSKEEQEWRLSELRLLIASNKVGKRPGRVEPRAVRHRASSFPKLKNRKDEQTELLKKQQSMLNSKAA